MAIRTLVEHTDSDGTLNDRARILLRQSRDRDEAVAAFRAFVFTRATAANDSLLTEALRRHDTSPSYRHGLEALAVEPKLQVDAAANANMPTLAATRIVELAQTGAPEIRAAAMRWCHANEYAVDVGHAAQADAVCVRVAAAELGEATSLLADPQPKVRAAAYATLGPPPASEDRPWPHMSPAATYVLNDQETVAPQQSDLAVRLRGFLDNPEALHIEKNPTFGKALLDWLTLRLAWSDDECRPLGRYAQSSQRRVVHVLRDGDALSADSRLHPVHNALEVWRVARHVRCSKPLSLWLVCVPIACVPDGLLLLRDERLQVTPSVAGIAIDRAPIPEEAPTVFISYRREGPEAIALTGKLAVHLTEHGFTVVHDERNPFPPEGWPKWSQGELQNADFVLSICTAAYSKAFEDPVTSGPGEGVGKEAEAIRKRLDCGSVSQIVPVIFDAADRQHVPRALGPCTSVKYPEDFEKLRKHLAGEPHG